MSNALLDSNIIIDHLNDIDQATTYLGTLPDWSISSLTVYEVLSGCTGERSNQYSKARQFFDYCNVISIDSTIAEVAASFQRKTGAKRKMADFLIAATAIHHGMKLATRNPADFKEICDSFQPYRI